VEYTVELDIYSGPLDLLLYLIKKDEVDIYDIPISRITEQYLEYIELLRTFDINIAGEFLVMAATLMLIKSRMLLPKEEISLEEEEEDPRAALVRQLIQYKRFKEVAGELGERAELQALKYPRIPETDVASEEEDGPPLAEVDLWDLLSAFKKVLQATGADITQTIVRDDIPIEAYMRNILGRLSAQEFVSFFDMFRNEKDRIAVVGSLLAILELVRRGRLVIEQNQLFGDIYLKLCEKEAA
jgi:segregation and condensation protein A